MDGTLTSCIIDFQDMRKRTGGCVLSVSPSVSSASTHTLHPARSCTLPLPHTTPGIPVGDLFVAMESWEEPERVKASMDVILELEEAASANISAKEGLLELLGLLRDSQVRACVWCVRAHTRTQRVPLPSPLFPPSGPGGAGDAQHQPVGRRLLRPRRGRVARAVQ